MKAQRLDAIDALRGVAIVWMAVFHFCFDLKYFGYLVNDIHTNPFWTWQRSAIVSLFLLCAGLSQAVAQHQGQGWPRFWRRWRQIAACALLVSAGSWLMFPQTFIYFGVLHGIAVMLLVVRLTAALGGWLWVLGGVAMALKMVAPWVLGVGALAGVFNARALNWLGFVSVKPFTEDYVPLLPWLALMWWGMAAGQWLLRNRPQWLAVRVPGAGQPLALLGRWSLSFYMLHQPVLLGLLTAWRWAIS